MRISRAVLILSVLAGLYLVGFPGDTPTEPNSDYVPGAVLDVSLFSWKLA